MGDFEQSDDGIWRCHVNTGAVDELQFPPATRSLRWPAEGEIWYNFDGNFVTKLLTVNYESKKVRYIHNRRNHVIAVRAFLDIWAWRRVCFANGRPDGFDVPPKERRPNRATLTASTAFEAGQLWRNHLIASDFRLHTLSGLKAYGWLNGQYCHIYLANLSGQDWHAVESTQYLT